MLRESPLMITTFVNRTIPKTLSWAQFISWFYYGFDLLIRNQWTNVDYLDCAPLSELPGNVTKLPTSLFGGGNGTQPPSQDNQACFHSGNDVIQFLDMGNKSEVGDFLGVFGLFFFLRTTAYLAMYMRATFSR